MFGNVLGEVHVFKTLLEEIVRLLKESNSLQLKILVELQNINK